MTRHRHPCLCRSHQVEVEELADNVHAAAVASLAASRCASPARALLPLAAVNQQFWDAANAGAHQRAVADQAMLAVADFEHATTGHFLEGNSVLLDKYRQAKAELRR